MALRIFDNRRDIADPIPRAAFLWLAVALVMSSLPFIANVPPLALLAVVGLSFWRYRIQVRGGHLPPTWLRLALFIGAIGLNLATYRTIFSMDSAMVLLLVLVGLKLLELRTVRDFDLVAFLCYFLVLAALFYNMTLLLFTYQLLVLITITAALIRLHMGTAASPALLAPLGRAALLFIQALPLIVVFYVFFPRTGAAFGSNLGRGTSASEASGMTGMSDYLEPGSMASVAKSTNPVLRASFPESAIPRPRDLYWRGMVLTYCRGFNWEFRNLGQSITRATQLTGTPVKQRISLEPSNNRWMFALDRPIGPAPSNADMEDGDFIYSKRRITSQRQYEVTSMVSPAMGPEVELTNRDRRINLDVPYEQVPERTRALAHSFVQGALRPEALVNAAFDYATGRLRLGEISRREAPPPWENRPSAAESARLAAEWAAEDPRPEALVKAALDYAANQGWNMNEERRLDLVNSRLPDFLSRGVDSLGVVNNAFNWFRSQNFSYTTSPGEYSENLVGLEEFLFDRQKGFCEHYAGSLGLLLRLAGLPTRVVIGYQGGIYNQIGNLMLVRDGDAHAWNEVWLEGQGWTRIDLTSAIAPDRVEFGMEAFAELEQLGATETGDRVAALTHFSTRYGLLQAWRDVRFAVDAVDYYWNLHVLSYDDTTQQDLLENVLRMRGGDNLWKLLVMMASILAPLFALIMGIMAWRQRPAPVDAIHRTYRELRTRLSRAGLQVRGTDGPLALSQRAAELFPAQAQQLSEIFNTYIRARYTPEGLPAEDYRPWRKAVRKLSLRENSSGS